MMEGALACSTGGFVGGVSPGIPGISPLPGVGIYLTLPLCIDQSGHRFAISASHKDRSCCERCGLIREAKS